MSTSYFLSALCLRYLSQLSAMIDDHQHEDDQLLKQVSCSAQASAQEIFDVACKVSTDLADNMFNEVGTVAVVNKVFIMRRL